MSSNADSLVRDAIAAYRAGRKEKARSLLLQAVELDEQHEQGWLWLSAVVDSIEDQMTCLENVLTVNPNNEKAKQGLHMLSEKLGTEPPATAKPASRQLPPEEDDPFANISFTQPVPEPTLSPMPPPTASRPQSGGEEELPTDIAWDTIETSSASARRPNVDTPPEVYGDWIAGLNIGSNEATEAFGPVDEDEPAFTASPFIGDDDLLSQHTPFELDEEVFGLEDDEEVFASSMTAGPFTASPFSAELDEDAPVEQTTAPTAASPSLPSVEPKRSPALRTDDRLLADIEDEGYFGDEDFIDDDNYDDVDLGTVDPNEFFKFIPSEIRPSRLPGTNEHQPALVVISLLLLFVLNAGAIALVYMTLTNS